MPIMFSLREEKQNASELKANKPTIIPSKISSAYECNKTIALLPRFEFTQSFEHEQTNNTLTKSHSTKTRLFYASRISSNHELHDDNRQTQSNAHFLMPNNQTLVLRLQTFRIHNLYSSFEQSDLSSLNSLNKNEHYKSASQNIQSGHDPTQKYSETSLMSKVPSKINNFEGLEKVCHKFPQTFPWKRHDMPHQTSTENDPQNIVTHRIWQSTIRHTYRHSPYLTKPQKVKSPPSTSPLFKTFF